MSSHATKIKECLDKYTNYSHLGVKEIARGSYGYVYAICEATEKDDSKCPKIVKIIINGQEETIAKEITIAQLLQHSGLTPSLDRVFNCGEYLFLVMDRYSENLEQRASKRFQDHKVILRTLEGIDFPFNRLVFTEQEVSEMFRIAKELSDMGIIHGDLKPNQFLWRKSDGKIVVTDFGFSGTTDGSIPAFRGWSWLKRCGNFQPLPPRKSDAAPYKWYFNMYQIWSWMACFNDGSVCIVLLNDGTSYAYMDSKYYTFSSSKTHPYYIPVKVLEMFKQDENQFRNESSSSSSARQRLIEDCRGKDIPKRIRIPTAIPLYRQ